MELYAGVFKSTEIYVQEKKECFELWQSPGLIYAAQQCVKLHPCCLVPVKCVTVRGTCVLLK